MNRTANPAPPVDSSAASETRSGTQNTFQIAAPSLSLPKGGGAIRGMGEKFAANPATGSGSIFIPIATSPGRSGFGPQLSLSYDSSTGNGPFGLGWNLQIPSITRKTDKGLPQYKDSQESDVFILSGADDLVPVLTQNALGQWVPEIVLPRIVHGATYRIQRYRPRVEGLFARIERWTNQADLLDTFWRSISRDNVTTWYGKTTESRIADPGDPGRIFKWLVCEIYDDKGNAAKYRYKAEDSSNVDLSQVHEANRNPNSRTSNRYLKSIRYGNQTPYLPKLTANAPWPTLPDGQWHFEVVLDYGEHDPETPTPAGETTQWPRRNDPFSVYRPGFEVRTYRLCQRVLMFHHFALEPGIGADCLVRSTDFTYSFEVNPGDARNPIFSTLLSANLCGYKRQADSYLKKSFPPVEFEYTQPDIDGTIYDVDSAGLENLPEGLDGRNYQWIDLDGEGLSGILTEQSQSWFYKRNLSPINLLPGNNIGARLQAKFGPVELVDVKPNFASSGGRAQFMDLAGDGQPDLVLLDSPEGGFFEHEGARWNAFRQFTSQLNRSTADPNVKLVDLDGDGHADVLITENDAFTWHSSLGEDGFGPALRVATTHDEKRGPALVLADGTQSIYLADLSGDGLTDLVRIRNGDVCYWPNLGYGRFGARVTMDNAPWFENPELFDHRRVRLADIDGSGVTDILYLHRDGVRIYFNQSGNSWSGATTLPSFPHIDDLASVNVVDLLGNGTACLVWSSPLPGNAQRPMRYIDLMGGQKPHLLVKTVNNLGAETHVRYTSSTRFYLEDKQNGNPWITRLPFPVQVVERVETLDRIGRNRFVTRYAYHDGHFDGTEREFRGFGMVEQFDTEELAALTQGGAFPDAANIDAASYVPTVLSRTWFHTGAYIEGGRISRHFEARYYREGDASDGATGLTDPQLDAMLLPDTELPLANLTDDELREACRALKGFVLRREAYALDGSARQDHPYSTSEQNYTIELLQPRAGNKYAIFFTHPRESIDFQYERRLVDVAGTKVADPRVKHVLTLEVDGFGNVLKSVMIGYGRRPGLSTLSGNDKIRQEQTQTVFTTAEFTNVIDAEDAYRRPLASRSRTYELIHVTPDQTQPAVTNLFRFDEIIAKWNQASDGSHELPYEDVALSGATTTDPYRRLIEHVVIFYRPDDLGTAQNDPMALLPAGAMQPLALPGETYKLAFTPGLLTKVFQRNGQPLIANPASVLGANGADGGGYVDLEGDGRWWIPSGRTFFSPDSNDSAVEEMDYARQHFFLERRYRNPFHTNQHSTESFVRFDDYQLLPIETLDALGNKTVAAHEYRLLSPHTLTDLNGNRTEAATDALGMMVGTAVMGKATEQLGDSLDSFIEDLDDSTVEAHLQDPLLNPESILQRATTRLVYDLFAFSRTKDQPNPQPAVVYTVIRETHDADLQPGEQTKIQHALSFSDGFAREIQRKIQAEPGPVPQRDADGKIILGPDGAPKMTAEKFTPRWVASGWTVFNNKAKPVRIYEPFFTDTHHFEFDVRIGVSPVFFYDPVGRVVARLHPNHSWEKVRFDAWQQERWDFNDTVLLDPKLDEDVKDLFLRLPEEDYFPTWFAQRAGGGLGTPEQEAANKTAVHAATPSVAHSDSLGRTFLTVAHNRFERNNTTQEEKYFSRVEFDIEGNQRAVIDTKERIVMRFDYDMTGIQIHQASMDGGDRWKLNDVSGNPIRAWDSRDHQFHTTYDELRRPAKSFLQEGNSPELLVVQDVYGESQPNPETRNRRGKVVKLFDQSGLVMTDDYDFKGNALQVRRQFAGEYKATLDWSGNPALGEEIIVRISTFDALNRPVTVTTPDGSLYRTAFNEANLLETVQVNLRGAPASTPFLTNVDYDAKGRRILCDHGNGIRTEYRYDPQTFRLTSLITTRHNDQARLQELSYTYDPAGNITQIRNGAEQTNFYNNQVVTPDNDYSYDAMYRLINATGREHIGQISQPETTWNDAFRIHLPQPGDGQAMRRYTEQYEYDSANNFERVIHQAANGNWTRTFAFNESSPIETGKMSNRLSSTTVGANSPEHYSYDAHGNMISMPHLTGMHWDYRDELQATTRQSVQDSTAETTWYVYDSSGQRVRKVTEKQNGTRKNERNYLGGYEVYREYDNGGIAVTLERETLHVMDDVQRIALVDTRTIDVQFPAFSPQSLIRFQFGNHLGSASLELDDAGLVISYEEYFPYGSTSYQAVRSATDVSEKRYRYTGMERDEESGLNYHTARYYAPWLGVWIAADPLALKDGLNRYCYVRNNPISRFDREGLESKQQRWQREFDADPDIRRFKGVGNVAGPRDEGVVTESGVRVPLYKGDYLSPRPFYESRNAALAAYQGFIHYAELLETHQEGAAMKVSMVTYRNAAMVPDDLLDLEGQVGWSILAINARQNAMMLAMIAMTAKANANAAAAHAAAKLEQTALARAASTQGNVMNVPNVKRTITSATGEETFVHTTSRVPAPHTGESAAVNIAETKSINLSTRGEVAQWGEGAYAYEGKLPTTPTTTPTVQFKVPKGTAIERIAVPGEQTIVRLVPPAGDTLTIVDPVLSLTKSQIKEAAEWLNLLRKLL